MDLSGPEFDPVFTYAEATHPGAPVQYAVRELLLMALAADPLQPQFLSARRRAYIDGSLEVRTLLARALNEARDQIDAGSAALLAERDHLGG